MSRKKLRNKREFRIFVHKSSQHFYAQLIDLDGNVKYAYSTLALKSGLKNAGESVNMNFINAKFVRQVSEYFAKSIKEIGVSENTRYDRGEKRYCGLVKLFADVLRENGILI
jgi:ribosomal protein L18